ncbi:alpha/beta hydrolase [Acidobacteria bacterium AH-259-D05]|nr:alpha/beta hydrolase [Acidobacteria bacterium AH-259-D05]
MQNPKYVNVKGIKTRYFDQGQGEPLVLIHGGNFGNEDNIDLADNWDLNWPWFVKWFHVYAPDKLGQGFTDLPQSDEDYTMAAIIGHAHDFIQEMGLKKVHLVGHSRGAYVVTRLTLEHPELVRTLVIVDSNTIAPGENPRDAQERSKMRRGKLLADTPKPLLTKESLKWVSEAFSYSGEHVTDEWINIRHRVASLPQTVEAIEKMSQLFSTIFLPQLSRQKEQTHQWIKEGKLKAATLLIWGYNDPSAVVDDGVELFKMIAPTVPRTHMHIFNNAGHYSYREHPEDFARVVADFILAGGSR